MVPMLRLATSGLKVAAGFTRSSTVMVGAPPVVMFTTQSERCLITLRNGANASGDWSGRPSLGLRACKCTTAAPASAAPMAASAISSAVIGRWGDIDGVWIEPVTAQVMMTLRALAMGVSSVVIPGLVPGIQLPSCSGASRTVDPGNKCRDDSAASLRLWLTLLVGDNGGEALVAPALLGKDILRRGRAAPAPNDARDVLLAPQLRRHRLGGELGEHRAEA